MQAAANFEVIQQRAAHLWVIVEAGAYRKYVAFPAVAAGRSRELGGSCIGEVWCSLSRCCWLLRYVLPLGLTVVRWLALDPSSGERPVRLSHCVPLTLLRRETPEVEPLPARDPTVVVDPLSCSFVLGFD